MKKLVRVMLALALIVAMVLPVYAAEVYTYDTETGRISGEYKSEGLVNTYIDGKLVGAEKTNVDVDFGSHKVEVFVNGRSEYEEIVKADMLRVYGRDRYATSIAAADAMKAKLGVSQFKTIVVACGTNFADALSGTYLAGINDAPIVLVNKATEASVIDYVNKNLASNGKVYILGGNLVVSANVENSLKAKFQVKRLAGTDRYGTNLAVLRETGVKSGDEILVCSGLSYADCLSASSAGKPILLVNKTLNDAQKQYLSGLKANYTLIGGTVAVTTNVEGSVKTYGATTRVGGNTRFDTSAMVAAKYFPKAEVAVLAYAMNFPDGLSGGPLGVVNNAPILLVTSSNNAAAASYAKAAGVKGVLVLGGPALISDAAARACVA